MICQQREFKDKSEKNSVIISCLSKLVVYITIYNIHVYYSNWFWKYYDYDKQLGT